MFSIYAVLGSGEFTAPENWNFDEEVGKGQISKKADIYSVGKLLEKLC